MVLNLQGRQKEIWAARQVRQIALLSQGFRVTLAREFERVSEALAANPGSIDRELALHTERLLRILEQHDKAVMPIFAQPVFQSFAEQTRGTKARVEIPPEYRAILDSWISSSAAAQVTKITTQTRAMVRRALTTAEENGLGIRETANAIRSATGGQITGWRAFTIGWTETHNAATFAQQQAAVLAVQDLPGSEITREWVSVEDRRTRPSHVEANGQKASLEGSFLVGGALLQRPGDPLGPAREVIKCRCIVAFSLS